MSYIIKSPDDLQDPFLCLCVFMRFDEEAGEDYLDYNENIINPYPFMMWLNGKGYISNDDVEKLLAYGNRQLTTLDILQLDILFPNTYGQDRVSSIKSYSLLAEYVSQFKNFRQRIYNSVNDEAIAFLDNQFYKNEDGISLACIIEDEQMVSNKTYTKEMVKNLNATQWVFDLTLREKYDFVKSISIKESDEIILKD